MKLGWRVLLPINLVWILSLAALQVARDPDTGDEKFVILGGFLVGVVLLALLWPSGKRAPDKPLEEQLKSRPPGSFPVPPMDLQVPPSPRARRAVAEREPANVGAGSGGDLADKES
jgi:NADH-quinone oxidoreductase subunit H